MPATRNTPRRPKSIQGRASQDDVPQGRAQASPQARALAERKSSSRDSVSESNREKQRVSMAFEEAKRIVAAQDPQGQISSDDASYNVHHLLRAFAAKVWSRQSRKASSWEEGNAVWDPLEVEWAIFKDWPEGLSREEKEMKQYYKYLKFIHLEHETKIRFITEIIDDLEADPPREAIVYTPRDVKEKESEMLAAKALLKEAKHNARNLREDIDSLTETLAQPYRKLSESCAEAKSLLNECMDLELELVKIKNERGPGALTEIDVNEMELENLPSVGSLTTEEAERFCERQDEELVALEESNDHLDSLMSRLRADAKAAIKDVDRLSSEKNNAERSAREAQALGIDGKKRDKQVEKACTSHAATLALLKSLLGLRRIEAIDDNTLDLHYVLTSDGCELELKLKFDQPGGRLVNVELHHPAAPEPTVLPLVVGSKASSEYLTTLRAVAANDVAAVVMEAWEWGERRSRQLFLGS